MAISAAADQWQSLEEDFQEQQHVINAPTPQGEGRRSIVRRGTLELVALPLVAGPEVNRLGIAFSTLPPQPVVVKRVTEGTWAYEQGMEAGDVLEAVNDRNVQELTGETFKLLLNQRPLTIRLGYLPEGRMPDDLTCQRRKTVFDTEVDCSQLDLVVTKEVKKIGMAFSTWPPEPLVVKRVTEGTWAYDKGIKKGDVFNTINGRCVGNLNAKEFARMMQKRPITLRMCSIQDSLFNEKLPVECRNASFDADVDGTRLDLVVSSDVEKIGMAFSTWPPESLVVKRVAEGTWAYAKGIKKGDVFNAINGRSVEDLNAKEFAELMKERPITLTLCSVEESLAQKPSQCRKTVFDADADNTRLDLVVGPEVDKIGMAFTDSIWPPESLVVKRVAENTWAYEKGIKRGDVFNAINGRPVENFKAEEFAKLMQTRPITLTLCTVKEFDTDVDGIPLDLIVSSEVRKIGMSFSTWPPELLVVKRVAQDTWADAKGIKRGDVFNAINGQPVSDLGADEFAMLMQERPLTLRMCRQCSVEDRDTSDSDESTDESSGTASTALSTVPRNSFVSSCSSTPSRFAQPSSALTAYISRAPFSAYEPCQYAGDGSVSDISKVWLHVYDLSGTEGTNNAVIGMGFGVFHTGVEVYGVEWSYGYSPTPPPQSGVYPFPPRRCPLGVHRESICLGQPRAHSAEEAWVLLERLGCLWLGREYHLIRHNCHHFCHDLCGALGVAKLPGWVGRLAVAADYVIMPFLDVFNVDVMPTVPPPTDPPPTEVINASTRSRTEDSDQGVAPRNQAAPHETSLATEVSLHFQKRFGWAHMRMLMCDLQRKLELHNAQTAREAPAEAPVARQHQVSQHSDDCASVAVESKDLQFHQARVDSESRKSGVVAVPVGDDTSAIRPGGGFQKASQGVKAQSALQASLLDEEPETHIDPPVSIQVTRRSSRTSSSQVGLPDHEVSDGFSPVEV